MNTESSWERREEIRFAVACWWHFVDVGVFDAHAMSPAAAIMSPPPPPSDGVVAVASFDAIDSPLPSNAVTM